MWYDVQAADRESGGSKVFFVFKRAYQHLKLGNPVLLPYTGAKGVAAEEEFRRLAIAHIWYAYHVDKGFPVNFFTLLETTKSDDRLPMGCGKLIVSSNPMVWMTLRKPSVMWIILPQCWRYAPKYGVPKWQEALYAALKAVRGSGPIHGVVYSLVQLDVKDCLQSDTTLISLSLSDDGFSVSAAMFGRQVCVRLFGYSVAYETVRELIG